MQNMGSFNQERVPFPHSLVFWMWKMKLEGAVSPVNINVVNQTKQVLCYTDCYIKA